MVQFRAKRVLRSLLLGLVCFLLISSAVKSQDKPVLTVAVEPVFPPFEFKAPNGDFQGFDVDLIRAVGQAGGFGVTFQSIPFDGIIPALQAGTADAAVAAMTITQARSQAVAFSQPYFKAGLAIAVRDGTTGITKLDDLKGKAIAVQIGTTGAKTASAVAGAKIRTFDAAVLALQELKNGNVDAVVNDSPVTLYAIKTGNLQGIRIVGQLLTEEFYGIPLPLNSPNLQRVNEGLKTILQNGTYAQIYQKWFNAQPPQLPESAFGTAQTAQQTPTLGSVSVILNALPTLLKGALITLQLAAVSVFFGLIGGSLIGIARLSTLTPVRWAARAYIDFFRGTPLLVQIFMIYFGFPALLQAVGLNFTFNRFAAAIVALSFNSAAYIAEIVRAGIQSIEVGQSEAAQSLGLDSVQTLRHVIFPQALRRMLPPLGNEFITLLKDTSLVAVIGFEELFREGQLIVAENYRPFELYASVALVYLALTLLSSQGFSYLERVMNPVKRSSSRTQRGSL
ncbi:MAG: ABC transporter permease subunit [Myxacorys chilensis ATA2-1-KO14]|jgi:arginine/lysine/histidine/glutamine transport system substrate-binding/permease protein|nr:ABC transporter permease subunit [Myxacorys chilensis ATA2-1-KO14]